MHVYCARICGDFFMPPQPFFTREKEIVGTIFSLSGSRRAVRADGRQGYGGDARKELAPSARELWRR